MVVLLQHASQEWRALPTSSAFSLLVVDSLINVKNYKVFV